MYQKGAKGWLKHFDFMLLDLIVLQLSFLVAFQIRHGMVNPYASRDYLALAIITELADIVAMIFLNTYEGVIRRGYFKEFISSFKNGFVIVALLLLYVFVLKDTSIYSRTTILLMWAIYVYATFAVRSLWKKHLEKYAEQGKGKKLLVMTTRHVADEVVSGLKEKNYSGFDIVGVMVIDANLVGQEIQEVPVVADYNSAVDYVRTAWVDEIYVDVRGAYGYANTLIDAFIEGGITVHMCISSIVKTHGDKQLIQKIRRKFWSTRHRIRRILPVHDQAVLHHGLKCAVPGLLLLGHPRAVALHDHYLHGFMRIAVDSGHFSIGQMDNTD